MHALVLKSHGHNVVVVEMRTEEQLQARAAGLSLWPNAQKLVTTYIPDVGLDDIVFRNPSFPIIDKNGNVLVDVPFAGDMRTSCWAGIHGLLWMACEREVDGHGSVNLRCGYEVHGLIEHDDHLVVAYKGKDGIEEKMTADLVVAADGARSHLRSLVLPDIRTEYVGYVAWRSHFPELDVPEELRSAVEGKMPLCMLDGSYILVYVQTRDLPASADTPQIHVAQRDWKHATWRTDHRMVLVRCMRCFDPGICRLHDRC
jgi:2-polyprenyl-6-methoxyphenol hydroxylase-like FAD-dependent oxidoreductase